MSALTTLEMDLDCNNKKEFEGENRVSLSHSLQIEKKREKDFLSRALCGSSLKPTPSIKEYLLDRMIARVLKKNEEARALFFTLYATARVVLGSLSLARARERFPSSPSRLFFSRVIFVSFKVGYAKSEFRERERDARARALKARDLFPRDRNE